MTSPVDANRDPDCIFCKIVAGDLPCFEVYQDDRTLAFMDINPVADGHVLVISKAHYENLFETPDNELGYVAAALRKVARAVNEVFHPDGISITQANGPGAAQSVMHYHCHVVPRWNGDELKINWGLKPGDMDAIRETASRIRERIE